MVLVGRAFLKSLVPSFQIRQGRAFYIHGVPAADRTAHRNIGDGGRRAVHIITAVQLIVQQGPQLPGLFNGGVDGVHVAVREGVGKVEQDVIFDWVADAPVAVAAEEIEALVLDLERAEAGA